jgi:hypothetical protein
MTGPDIEQLIGEEHEKVRAEQAKVNSAKIRVGGSGERFTSTDAPGLTDSLYNDHGNACRLIALYGEDFRYCHAFKKWLGLTACRTRRAK